MLLRTEDDGEGQNAIPCETRGCTAKGKHGKPRCAVHILHLGYPAWIVEEADRRAREIDGVMRPVDPVDPPLDGIVVADVLWVIGIDCYGRSTMELLVQRTALPARVVGRALALLGARRVPSTKRDAEDVFVLDAPDVPSLRRLRSRPDASPNAAP